jgi:hypothetical protein
MHALDAYLRDPSAVLMLRRAAGERGRLPEDVAMDLVWEVLGDTVVGEARCDATQPLGPQLQREVRRRAARLHRGKPSRRSARQGPRTVALGMVPESALAVDAPAGIERRDDALDPEELLARIRELARGDEIVQKLLGLYDRGRCSRRAALSAGMTERGYRSARQRLRAYAAAASTPL